MNTEVLFLKAMFLVVLTFLILFLFEYFIALFRGKIKTTLNMGDFLNLVTMFPFLLGADLVLVAYSIDLYYIPIIVIVVGHFLISSVLKKQAKDNIKSENNKYQTTEDINT